MTTLTKFEFETDFDAEPLEPEPGAECEVEPPPPTFSEAELFAASEEGFARGREAGATDARTSIENAIAQSTAAIADQLGTMGERYQEAWTRCRDEALALSAAMTRKAVPEIVQDRALDCIEKMITETLPRLIEEPRVVIRVPDAILDPLQERIREIARAAGFAGQVILLAEAGLAGPDCRIEWADGGAEFESKRLWRDIDAVIAEHLEHPVTQASAGADQDAPDPDPDRNPDPDPDPDPVPDTDDPPSNTSPQETTHG
jgi:flagellar assembly protein FliH